MLHGDECVRVSVFQPATASAHRARDVFDAGLITARLQGKSEEQAARLAATSAAVSATHLGSTRGSHASIQQRPFSIHTLAVTDLVPCGTARSALLRDRTGDY